jgi:GDP-4-dehydro-6-deoxy-D-mannose reductase
VNLNPISSFIFQELPGAKSPSLFYQCERRVCRGAIEGCRSGRQKGTPVLLVGTAAEYGLVGIEDLPVREDHPPHPYNHYGISKLAQTLAGLAASAAGHKVVVVRPGNILGPRMPRHLLLGRILEELERISSGLQGARIEVGNLDVARDFVDVESVVKIYWSLIRDPKAYGEVINVCSGEAIPVRTLVEGVMKLSGIEAELVQQPALMRTHDLPVFTGSIEKLRRFVEVPRFETHKTLTSILDHVTRKQ